MNEEQFQRWEDVSLRMARACFPWFSERRQGRLIEELQSFFAMMRQADDYRSYGDWDGYLPDQRGLDSIADAVHEYWQDDWRTDRQEERPFPTAIRCCIRAGADLAIAPSAGVLGFRVGDLRRMFPEGLPDWLTEGWTPPLESVPDDAGILL